MTLIPNSPGTLRALHHSGGTITAYCSNYRFCSHAGEVRVEALIQHLGWDFEYIRLRGRMIEILVCSICGKRHPELRFSPPMNRPANGHSLTPSGTTTPAGSRVVSYAQALASNLAFRKAHPAVPAGGKNRRRWR